MSSFEPIAIVGQGCVLPGALSPDQLWQAVAQGNDLTSAASGSDWGIDIARVMTQPGTDTTDKTWSAQGGYVRGFEQVFDPGNFRIDSEQVAGLNSGVQWCLHAARQALADAGLGPFEQARSDVGVILGNLAYAPRAMQDYTARFWLEQQGHTFTGRNPADLASISTQPAQRFFSAAAPAQITASAIGATGTAFCLDAACASSLYAIKLACEQLQDRKANIMLAGALNHADDLYLHIGFTALQALSRDGVARPFDRRADGLVPGAGAAIVVLKRLQDARRDGDTIAGVIRGIGLSNDGRVGGFLSPSSAGQVQAIEQAYRQCDITPDAISYLECHATGTSTGDAIELQSIRQVFGDRGDIALASLKGNIGHLITAAGAAGLIRLLAAMQHDQLARSIHVDRPINGLDGGPAESGLRLLREPEAWSRQQPRIAGLNAFGFGGNNAHMIVQHQLEPAQWPVAADLARPQNDADTVVITGLQLRTAASDNHQDFVRALLAINDGTAADHTTTIDRIDIPLPQLGFPPTDLDHTLGQQLLIMQLVRDLAASSLQLIPQTTSVLVGMGTDPNTTRYATRTRLAQWLEAWRAQGLNCSDEWFEQAKTAISEGLNAAGVLGTMPNIPANRSNHQLDLRGPSYTVAGEELSGIHCLQIAARSLQRGEVDAAIVGAVDLSHSAVYQQALRDALSGEDVPHGGDAGVAILLKRRADAERDGDTIIAELGDIHCSSDEAQPSPGAPGDHWGAHQARYLYNRFGHSHATSGLLNVAAAALMSQHRLAFDPNSGNVGPSLETSGQCWNMQLQGLDVNGGGRHQANLTLRSAGPASALTPADAPRLYRYAGPNLATLVTALQDQRQSTEGAVRLAIIAANADQLDARRTAALARLTALGDTPPTGVSRLHNGVYLSTAAMEGELGLVFTGAASAYPGMGRELLMALPEAVASTVERFPVLRTSRPWLDAGMAKPDSEFAVLQGCSLLSQIHARISLDLLKLQPQAMLGVSSGETNSMYAAGAWHDMDAMFQEIDESGMYQRWIAGDFQAARTALGIDHPIGWQAYRVIAPAEQVAALLADQTHVYLTMINAGRDCVIGGESEALATILPKIKALATAVVPLGHDIIAHCPVMTSWQAPWRKIHQRETTALPDLRFYSNARGGCYQAEREAIADALTDQATAAVDFRRVVEAAYADGVRIFVEQGPRPLCSQWISDTLGARPHLSVHLDRPGAGLVPLYEAVAQLWCAGVAVDCQVLETLNNQAQARPAPETTMSLPAHPPEIELPALPPEDNAVMNHRVPADDSSMPSAPQLASALQPLFADDPDALEIIRLAVLSAPQPSYTMPDPAESTQQPAPAMVHHSAEAPTAAALVGQGESMPAGTLSANDAFSPFASGTLQNLHAQLTQTHQQYLAMQNNAMQQLIEARARFAGQPDHAVVAHQVQAPSPVHIAPPAGPAAEPPAHATPPAVPARPKPVATSSGRPAAQPPSTISARPSANANSEAVAPHTRPAPAEARAEPTARRDSFPGPSFDREQLKVLAGGKISSVLGPLFEQQDDYQRQVRMPCPPLLLADRVLGIDATPGAMENTGTIWTETDVNDDDWYLHHGHMPAGIMIESGQADLLLISWMGADFENRGERVYRLLGCELTYRAGLPAIDDTLRYDIHVDGYAKQGDVRLFFFHYNCEIEGQRRLEVHHGQAGFFTHEELANSAGVIWDAANETPRNDLRVDPAPQPTTRQQFDLDDIRAFADGDLVGCFGAGFEPTQCHQRTPTIAAGKMMLFDRVTELNHQGGPWQRGYIRAELDILPDHWFFDGHFKNDPCMPGTLMFEGGMQVMAFYLASLGFTLPRDGWRFEPVKDEAFQLKCRSQLIPGAKLLVCELYIHGVEGGSTPRVRADMMCSVDGRKAFLGESVGIELVPGWPQESRQHMLPEHTSSAVAHDEQFPFDERAMAACAWGRPSQAFGPHYAKHDGPRRGPRLPGYPYHFISRIIDTDAVPRAMQSGGRVSVEYDVAADAWYFEENSQATMPFPVLLEAALQPCGWLATYMGGGFEGEDELFFRNLDGTATWHTDVLPDAGQLRTEVENTSVSQVGSMTIVGFKVRTSQGSELVYEMDTVFGFFPAEALAAQAGLPASDEERQTVTARGNIMRPLRQREARFFNYSLRLPGPMLCLLERITDLHITDAETGCGHIRAEMDVDPNAWYFKSHFYGDPVQPGSLGLEMMLQCLQYFAIDQNLGKSIPRPRFEAVARPHSWSYRGQVLPHNKVVTCDLEVTAIDRQSDRLVLVANATLWADGTKIYRADDLCLAIVETSDSASHAADITLDRAQDYWVNDHCPTWTVPALPMTNMLDQLASAAAKRCPGKRVTGFSGVKANRWLDFNTPRRHLHSWARATTASKVEASLLAWEAASSRYETVADGIVQVAEQYRFAPTPWPPLASAPSVDLPYAKGTLFHGPAFQAMRTLRLDQQGSSAQVDAGLGQIPQGSLNPGFLDACLHGIPHDNLQLWFPNLEVNVAAYPLLILSATLYGPTPTAGLYRVEARPLGLHAQRHLPQIGLQIIDADDKLWAQIELVEAILPKGTLGSLEPTTRRAFITHQAHDDAARLSSKNGGGSLLSIEQVRSSNWLPGTLEQIYQSAATDVETLTRDIVAKEQVAALTDMHPARVAILDDGKHCEARSLDNLLVASPLTIDSDGATWTAASTAPAFDLTPVRDYWRRQLDKPGGLEEDLFLALACRFVSSVRLADASLLAPQRGRGVLFLANHQVGVESMLFSILMGGFMGQNVVTLAKQEHRDSWIGRLLRVLFDATQAPDLLHLLNRDDPQDVLLQMTTALGRVSASEQSLLVHAGGTRALRAAEPLPTISTALIGAAVASGVDIVPVAFRGGLPLDGSEQRLEFPVGYASQQIVVGSRIHCDELRSLTGLEQKNRVLEVLNPMLTDASLDRPGTADTAFTAAIDQLVETDGVNPVQATLWHCLQHAALPSSVQSQRLIALVEGSDTGAEQADDAWLRAVSEVVFGR